MSVPLAFGITFGTFVALWGLPWGRVVRFFWPPMDLGHEPVLRWVWREWGGGPTCSPVFASPEAAGRWRRDLCLHFPMTLVALEDGKRCAAGPREVAAALGEYVCAGGASVSRHDEGPAADQRAVAFFDDLYDEGPAA